MKKYLCKTYNLTRFSITLFLSFLSTKPLPKMTHDVCPASLPILTQSAAEIRHPPIRLQGKLLQSPTRSVLFCSVLFSLAPGFLQPPATCPPLSAAISCFSTLAKAEGSRVPFCWSPSHPYPDSVTTWKQRPSVHAPRAGCATCVAWGKGQINAGPGGQILFGLSRQQEAGTEPDLGPCESGPGCRHRPRTQGAGLSVPLR